MPAIWYKWANDEMVAAREAALKKICVARDVWGFKTKDGEADAPKGVEERLAELDGRVRELEIERDARDTEAMERSERDE